MTARTWYGPSGSATKPQSGNWSLATNWSPSGVPVAGDTLTIGSDSQAATFTLTVDTAAVAASITMNGSPSTLHYTTVTLTAGNSLTTSGAITFSGSSAVVNVINGAGTLDAGGGITGTGTIMAGTAAAGGTLDVTGTIASGVVLSIGTFAASDLKIEGTATSAAAITINNANQTLEIGASGALTISAAQSITNGTIKLDGGTLTDSSGVTLGAGSNLTGFGTFNPAFTGSNSGTVTATGGTLALTSNISASSGLTFDVADSAASILKLNGTVGATNTFTFLGTHGAVELNDVTISTGGLNFSGTVSNLDVAGSATPDVSTIDYINVQQTITKVTVTDSTHIELFNGGTDLGTVTLGTALGVGQYVDWAADTSLTGHTIGSGTDIYASTQPCYLRGTRILTPEGEVPVEDLAAGDAVVTASGAIRPIKWIGRRDYVTRLVSQHARDKMLPIRFARGSLGEGLPKRDLFVSPEHAMALDDVLIPARHLVNGASIAYCDAFPTIEYFHVELASHDVIFAEGAAAETYFDAGNRNQFSNVLDWLALGLAETEPQQPCAPMVTEGPLLAAVRQRLQARIPATGFELTTDPDLHLVTDSAAVRGECVADKVYRFELAACPERPVITSRVTIPADVDPDSTDRRPLGVPIKRIVLKSAHATIEIGHDEPSLTEGFFGADAAHRWTTGNAVIPARFPACLSGPVHIEVHLAARNLRYARRTDGEAAVIPMSADRRELATAA